MGLMNFCTISSITNKTLLSLSGLDGSWKLGIVDCSIPAVQSKNLKINTNHLSFVTQTPKNIFEKYCNVTYERKSTKFFIL